MLVLGHTPTKAELLLRAGCDFTWTLTVSDDELLDDPAEVTLYMYERDGDDPIAFWPALWVAGGVVPGEVIPDRAQIQIYADDHALIPDGAKFTVALKKSGFPKTAWLEGRVSKVNR